MTEPFAWFRYQQGDRVYYDSKKWDDCQPLYTSPPQRTWVGLTIEEIASCCRESTTTQLSFAQELEAKFKEKNNGIS